VAPALRSWLSNFGETHRRLPSSTQSDRAKMSKPLDLFKAGELDKAIGALGEELRHNPTDAKNRTFLFELLCFSGDYARAEKQLDVLGQAGPQSEMGAVFYRGVLHATKTREDVYPKEELQPPPESTSTNIAGGTLNGSPFQKLVDADPRIGASLEVFAAGSYLRIPFSLISSIEIGSPHRLRDLLWIPATIRTTPAFQGRELGETILPALTPFAAKHSSSTVRLGRETVWEEDKDGGLYPVGQKILLVDDQEIPILDVRKLDFAAAPPIS
jgi:type VI secretion system protein ImpE